MTTEARPVQGRVSGTVRLEGLDEDAASRLVESANGRASELTDNGRLDVEAALDADGRAWVELEGAVVTALRVLETRNEGGDRLFPEQAHSTFVVHAQPVSPGRVVAINDHLMGASENHPRDDTPLDFRAEYDESEARLALRLSGSLFATSYLMFLIHMQLTQGRS